MRTILLSLLCLAAAGACGASADSTPFAEPSNLAKMRSHFAVDEAAVAMLRRNGFVVLDQVSEDNLARAYPSLVGSPYHRDTETFVTTDVLLTVWFGVHRGVLRTVENEVLAPRLAQTVTRLAATCGRLRATGPCGPAASALRDAAITLAVAERLLHEDARTPADLRPRVDAIVAAVLAHSEADVYPEEDYTQFTVRGRYADSPAFARYFRGAMWLSRRFGPVDPAPANDPDARLREAVALAAVLRADPEARQALRRMNAVRGYLAGTPNAISTEQLIAALERALGKKWSLATAVQTEALARLRSELGRDLYPRATVWTRVTLPGIPFSRKVIALLPDAAVPDSALFQATVEPAILGRQLPSPLEVGAALGSPVARSQVALLPDGGDRVLAAVDAHPLPGKAAPESIYGGWLGVLSTLFRADARAPRFMHGDAWRCEKLNTCLSSWTQLRHSHLLYGSQSGSVACMSQPLPALVEPVPEFFRALAGLARRTRDVLAATDALPVSVEAPLLAIQRKCAELERYARAQLEGKLTPEQSAEIAAFGSWLEQFDSGVAPMVADVATAGTGEILHAATGLLNPLLVVPDPDRPVAYLGWVSSYYEFRRPSLDRLTDARWQEMHRNTYLRPDRPEWAREFVHLEGGKEWQSRAPLREAERLLGSHPDEGLALLRRIVSDNRENPLGTEAQYRIGKHYLDRKEFGEARVELARCRRLYGCEWSRRAHTAALRSGWQEREEPRDTTTMEQVVRARIASLGAASLSRARRERLERELAGLVLGRPTHPIAQPERLPELVDETAAACRTPAIRDVLGYASLRWQARIGSARSRSPEGAAAAVSQCLAFARRAASPPLRAAALALAVEAGLHRDAPLKALALLKPYADSSVFDPRRQPALRIQQEVAESSPWWPEDPRGAYLQATGALRERLMEDAYHAGRLEEMLRLAREIPAGPEHRSDDDLLVVMARSFSDLGREPLRLYAQAQGLAERKPAVAAARYLEVYRRYPRARLAPFALWHAMALDRAAGNVRRADETSRILSRRYPNSNAGILVRLRVAAGATDVDEIRRLVPLLERDPGLPYELLMDLIQDPADCQAPSQAVNLLQWHDAMVKALAPLAKAAGKPDLLKMVGLHGDTVALAEKVAGAVPERAAEAYVALLDAGGDRGPDDDLCEAFLKRFPRHARAEEARWHLASRGGPRGGYAQGLEWFDFLVPFINAGPSNAHHRDALEQFQTHLQDASVQELRRVANALRTRYPRTPADHLAHGRLAHALLDCGFQEEAIPVLEGLLAEAAADDPQRPELAGLALRAQREVWGKRQPEWIPVWSVQPGVRAERSYLPDDQGIPPLLAYGLVILRSVADNRTTGVIALDEDTGAVRWRARVGPVCSIQAGPGGRIFCGTDTSSVVALEAVTGRILWEKVLDLNRGWSTWAAPVGECVAASSQAACVVGLDGESGRLLWQKESLLVRGLPAVTGDSALLLDERGRLQAVDARTGVERWKREYPPVTGGGTPLPPPVAVGPDAVLVWIPPARSPQRPGETGTPAAMELLNAVDGSVRRAAVPLRADEANRWAVVGDVVACLREHGATTVLRLPGLQEEPQLLPKSASGSNAVAVGGNIYLVNADDRELQAVDLASGAVLARSLGGADTRGAQFASGKRVYVAFIDGHVDAFPLFPQPPAAGMAAGR